MLEESHETTYLETGNTLVTSSRIRIGARTFATRNVGAVSVDRKSGKLWPWIVAAIGALMMIPPLTSGAASDGWIFGACVLVVGALWGWRNRGHFELTLQAAGNSSVALQTRDQAAMTQLHDAIVQAISSR